MEESSADTPPLDECNAYDLMVLRARRKREKADRVRLAGTVEHLEEQLANLQARVSRPAINAPSDAYEDAADERRRWRTSIP